MPYYVDDYPKLSNKEVRIFLKYNNDNNPFYVATITPVTIMGGLTKVGGYITIFGLLKIVLFLYNQYSFENKLLKKYKDRIKDALEDNYESPIDKKTIRELMSYEMLMELVLAFLKERKGNFERDFDSDSTKLSLNRKATDLVEDIENIQNDKTQVTTHSEL